MPDRPFQISDHARKNMSLRAVTKNEVFDTILNYQRTDLKGNQRRYFKGNLCVVVAEKKHFDCIMTVLLNTLGSWTDEDVRNRNK